MSRFEKVFRNGIEDAWEPSFICTDVASMVHTLMGPKSTKIWGFSAERNPKATFFWEGPEPDPEEGHHFAVVADRYIVDPWLFTVNHQGGMLARSVFDLQDANDRELVEYFYGDARQWVRMKSEENLAPQWGRAFKGAHDFAKNYIAMKTKSATTPEIDSSL